MYSDTSLEAIAHIRMRPHMYVDHDIHNMADLIFRYHIEEAPYRKISQIDVNLLPEGWITIRDDGIGIPIEPHPKDKEAIPFLTRLMTRRGIFRLNGEYMLTASGFGLVLVAVNVLSVEFQVTTVIDGTGWRQIYHHGQPQTPVETVENFEHEPGTVFHFQPDTTIFEKVTFDRSWFVHRLPEIAEAMPNVMIKLHDERESTRFSKTYYRKSGGQIEQL